MAENLYRKAMGNGPQAVTATIFWLKTRAQWKETIVQEQTVTHGPVLRIVRHIVRPGHGVRRQSRLFLHPSLFA
jgi:hypothetical protein